MTASSQALDDAILAVLREQWPVPIATGELIRRVANSSRYSDAGVAVYRRLYAMARTRPPRVRAERIPDQRRVSWLLTERPEPLDPTLQQLDSSLWGG